MILMTLRIKVPSEKRSDIISLFESYRGPVSVHPGCVNIHLYAHHSTGNAFILVEEWNSRGAFEDHVRSNDFLRILTIMELAVEPPDLRFHTVSSVKGFELVERLREKGSGTFV
jgi:quinol monooxygenase YgiN